MPWWSCPAAPVLSQWRLVCRVLASLSCGTVSPQAPLLDHLLPAHSERMYGKTLAVESVVIAHTLAITKWSSTVESSVNENCFFYCNHIFVVFPTRMPFYFRLSVPLQSIAISTAVTHTLSHTIDHHTCSPTTSSFREVKSPSEVWDCSVTVILPY